MYFYSLIGKKIEEYSKKIFGIKSITTFKCELQQGVHRKYLNLFFQRLT
jgi:hypothetical protein